MKFKITDLRTNEVVNEFELEGCTSTGDAVRSIYGHVVPDWVSCEAVQEPVVETEVAQQETTGNEQGTKGADGSDTSKPTETIGGDDDASGKDGGQGKSRNGKSKSS